MMEIIKMKKEELYKSRRIWGATLTLMVLLLIGLYPGQYQIINTVALCASSILGLHSWSMPKKN